MLSDGERERGGEREGGPPLVRSENGAILNTCVINLSNINN